MEGNGGGGDGDRAGKRLNKLLLHLGPLNRLVIHSGSYRAQARLVRLLLHLRITPPPLVGPHCNSDFKCGNVAFLLSPTVFFNVSFQVCRPETVTQNVLVS